MKNTTQRLILVVDDDQRWRKIIIEMLQLRGYLIKIATCYEEAENSLDVLTRYNIRPSLAILDLLLDKRKEKKDTKDIEDYEGVTLLPKLSQLGIPYIVFTAYGYDAPIVRKVMGEFGARIIDKADEKFDLRTFADAIEQTLAQQQKPEDQRTPQQPQSLGNLIDFVVTSLMALVTFGGIIGILLVASRLTVGIGVMLLTALSIFAWFILLVFAKQSSGAIEQSQFGQLLNRILDVIERMLPLRNRPRD